MFLRKLLPPVSLMAARQQKDTIWKFTAVRTPDLMCPVPDENLSEHLLPFWPPCEPNGDRNLVWICGFLGVASYGTKLENSAFKTEILLLAPKFKVNGYKEKRNFSTIEPTLGFKCTILFFDFKHHETVRTSVLVVTACVLQVMSTCIWILWSQVASVIWMNNELLFISLES
jgi:hypothetical protein